MDPVREFEIGSLIGLSSAEVTRQLQAHGYNELPATQERSLWAIFRDVVREPMFLLLMTCGGVYLLLGEAQNAVMLLGFVFVVMGITLYQERKTERALEALRDLSSPRALVIREGTQRRIPGREVVRDDVVILAEGDRVPADATLLWCNHLKVDESLLTGESVPVQKTAWDGALAVAPPGGENLPFAFSGTLVVQGQGVGRVHSIGTRTEMGKIGTALQRVESEPTLLQQEIGSLVRRLAIFGGGLCLLVVAIYGITRHDWLNGLLAGITLAMAMLPEEFPVVLTIFLALGAWRLSKKNVLTRHVAAIETLGAATVLCVDKTGTLTMNQMSIQRLTVEGASWSSGETGRPVLSEPFHEILEYGILASQRDPFDPMEKAFHDLGARQLAETEHLHADWDLIHEYPLSPELLALSHVWRSPTGTEFIIAAKGAPEAIADLCHLNDDETRAVVAQVEEMARDGLRVLGVARSAFRLQELPEAQHDFVFEFLGLVGLADPLRPTVPAAVAECYSAGIRVVMITGDHPMTAQSIARQIGLTRHANGGDDQVITGPEFDRLDDVQLRQRIGSVSIFARMAPEQKLRLVSALKANGEIVAMTGDGVNDAPALKAAHIGIAMGGRGTDVAREAAALVLLDDDFSSIVQAIRMGRRIYDHLGKAMTYVMASHVPIAGMSLLPVIFRWPLVLMPVHILFLELLIDPACSVAFEAEAEEPSIMQRPPRKPEQRLLGSWTITLALLQGISVLGIVLAVFAVSWYSGHDELHSRALSFTTLIVANLGLILVNRSWSRSIFSMLRAPNPALWWVVCGTLAFLGVTLYVPFVRDLFRFSKLSLIDLAICLASGVVSILWFEALKAWRNR